MEEDTKKILDLQEEIIKLQKTSYTSSLESIKTIEKYKTTTISLLLMTFLSLLYAVVISLLYYR